MVNIKQNIFFLSFKFVFIDLIGDIIYFPIWWHSRGLKKFSIYFWQKFINAQKRFGVLVWIKNLFRPMYGQTDWQSKIISFFMRLANIIVRSIMLVIWAMVLLVVYIIWIALPLVIVYHIVMVSTNIF